MKNIKNIFWFLIFLSLVCLGQVEDPLEYYPHNVGDAWQYQRVPEGTIRTIQITRVDTSSGGNEHYIFFGGSNNWSIKVVVDSALVYYSGIPNPWYKLNIPKGSIWTREVGVEWVKYGKDDSEYKWGQELQTRVYYQYFWNPPDSSSGYDGSAEILARGIGILRYEWEGGKEELTGCIINGVKYGTIVGVEENSNEEIINTYQLKNYPNPFNGQTKIYYSIPANEEISIKVYNSLGQEIKELYRGYRTIGSYIINWKPGNISSGVYLVVFQTPSQIITNKTIYLK